MRVCRLVWKDCGSPASPKPTEPHDGPCYWCGDSCAPEGVRLAKVAGPMFSDHDSARCTTATHVCVPCTWVLGGKPPDTFRMWTVSYTSTVDAPASHEKAAPARVGPHTHLAGRNDLAWPLSVLLDPPRGAWGMALAESGKIHTLPHSRLNRSQSRWTVRFDRVDVSSYPSRFRHILHHAADLYAAGYNKQDIRTLSPSPSRIAKLGISQWRVAQLALAGAAGGAELDLALFLLRKDNAEEIRDRTRAARGEVAPRDAVERVDGQNTADRLVEEGTDSAPDCSGVQPKPPTDGVDDGAETRDRRGRRPKRLDGQRSLFDFL